MGEKKNRPVGGDHNKDHEKKKETGQNSVQKRAGGHLTLIIALVVVICSAYMLFSNRNPSGNSASEDTQQPSTEVINIEDTTQAPTESQTEASYDLSTKDYPQVTELCQDYFEALQGGDMDTLRRIMAEPPKSETVKAERQYIQSYDNVECYTREGIVEGSYVTYIYYEVKFKDIDTAAPSLQRQYICTNEDGDLYINNGTVDGEVASYLTEMQASEPVQELVADVNESMEDAQAGDKKLAAFIKTLKESSDTKGSDKKK